MKTPPATLTQLQRDTIAKAVRNLEVLGCKFAVIDVEGNTFGDLTVVKPKKRDNSTRHRFSNYGYVEKVHALQPGQSELFEAPEGVPAEKYRGAISACASTRFGPGNCTSHVEGNIIELLRLA